MVLLARVRTQLLAQVISAGLKIPVLTLTEGVIEMAEPDRVKRYFRNSGLSPCKEAGMPYDIVILCPKAGWGGCLGRYGECDSEFIEMSIMAREMGENIGAESFTERFGLKKDICDAYEKNSE